MCARPALGFGYFAGRGIVDAQTGEARLAKLLLRVDPKGGDPIAFDLEAMSGGQVSLASLADKVVFLNFWATWCPPCVDEMPSMMRLHQKFAAHPRFAMLAVSADEEWDAVRRFFAEKTPGFSVLLDRKGEIARQYGTEKFPETYIIVNGKLTGWIVGPRDWATWYAEAYVESLLSSPGHADHAAPLPVSTAFAVR